MKKEISFQILENPKLLNQLMEQSYWIKNLNRNKEAINDFKKNMKIIYKERISDKISDAIDGIDMISSVIESIK